MKYFTKEWVEKGIFSELCFQLRKNAKAAVLDERYFSSLYSFNLKNYTKIAKRKAKFLRASFDPAVAEKEFAVLFEENLNFLKKHIPNETLEKAADIRILALGEAEHAIVDEITRICGNASRGCDAVTEAYETAREKLAEKLGWYKINSLEAILNSTPKGYNMESDITVDFFNDISNTQSKLILKNANVTSGEMNNDARVIHYEIYETETGIAFGFLCEDENGALYDFSAECSDVELV